jgi:hypothetical protein
MNRKLRELEAITLAMFAALPLYATYAVSPVSVLVFHLTMTALGIRMALQGTDFSPLRGVIQIAGAAYLLFFPLDAMFLSRSLIRASGHLIFFIAIYQTVEASWRKNQRQRFLTTFLLFVTSVATATHISIVLYVAGFTFLCFRHLIRLSNERMSEQLGLEPTPLPAARAAFAYVLPTTLIAALLFPVLPRVRSPFVSGFTGNLGQSATGISESIDFTEARSISPDPEVISRVWMSREAVPFFTPLRLRVRTYQRFENGEWRSGRGIRARWMDPVRGGFPVARPEGFSRTVTVQQKSTREQRAAFTRLFLPVGTHTIIGLSAVLGNLSVGQFLAPADPRGWVNYQVVMSRETLPLSEESFLPISYPITPEVAQFARAVVGNAGSATQAAAKIETHMATRFEYVADPAELGRAISVEEFLLRERRGHCEYFAAGMVVMLTAVNVPARIVGGYYGGDFNPLTGYFILRQRDAHAWVEVWDGGRWRTYDSTPPSLRPGSGAGGLVRAYVSAITDSVNYFWDRYVLTFGLLDQVALIQEAMWRSRRALDGLKRELAQTTRVRFDPWLLGFILAGALVVLGILRLTRRHSIFERLRQRLAGLGVSIDQSTTAYELMEQLRFLRPDLTDRVQPIVELYVRDRFSPMVATPEERAAVLRAIASLR